MTRILVGLCASVSMALLMGCIGYLDTVETDPESLIQAPHHLAVPFFPDNKDQCGPATLASVLTFWGTPTEPRDLQEEIYMPRLSGTLPMDLLLAARVRGLHARMYNGDLDNLKAELDAGHPLVAFLNLGYALFPQGHYVVVTGYDDERRGVYLHSGVSRDVFLPYEQFFQSWNKTSRWTLLVLPADSHRKDSI